VVVVDPGADKVLQFEPVPQLPLDDEVHVSLFAWAVRQPARKRARATEKMRIRNGFFMSFDAGEHHCWQKAHHI
jgi:hypothetical protein